MDALETNPKSVTTLPYSVEYFHIYIDETINDRHLKGLDYLREIEKTWDFDYSRIILIDDYSPTEQCLTADDIIEYLKLKGMTPDFWALEGDLIDNAKQFLGLVENRKLRNNYINYIDKHERYPCSLLTASWYLTRLGYLDFDGVIKGLGGAKYTGAKRLLNLLPQDYQSVELRARTLIEKSSLAEAADKIQDLFYPIDSGRELDLF